MTHLKKKVDWHICVFYTRWKRLRRVRNLWKYFWNSNDTKGITNAINEIIKEKWGGGRIHGLFPSGTEAILMVNEQSHRRLNSRHIQGRKRRQGNGCPESGQ